MMLLAFCATLVALSALLLAEYAESVRGVWIAKPLASLGFLATAWAAGATSTPYGMGVLGALVLSFIGDVLLISPVAFKAGLFSFLLGHLAFIGAFVVRGVSLPASFFCLCVIGVLSAFIGKRILSHVQRELFGAVVAYIVVISAMVTLAAGTVGHAGRPVILGAALLFYVSDLTVARDKFIAPGFVNRAIGLPLYYIAQLLFALSVRG